MPLCKRACCPPQTWCLVAKLHRSGLFLQHGVQPLQVGLKSAEDTLAAAENLLSKLRGEQESWHEQVLSNTAALESLPACALVASAFIVYAAGETEAVRRKLLEAWRCIEGLSLPEDFLFAGFLGSETDFMQWRGQGLAGDKVCQSCHNPMDKLQWITPCDSLPLRMIFLAPLTAPKHARHALRDAGTVHLRCT